tara:strand:- start:24 stop:176 length:153 start_codon:yes stop_codon:yes gene_type:complete
MIISGVLEIASFENKALANPGDTARYNARCLHATHTLNVHAMAVLIVENS